MITLRRNGVYGRIISDEEWQNAIRFLNTKIDKKTKNEIAKELKVHGKKLSHVQHFNLGLTIRNLLRSGGFNWDDSSMDRYWYRLLKEMLDDL